MKKVIVVAIAGALASISFGQVLNGGFETGTFASWTVDSASSFLAVNGSSVHTGSFAMQQGALAADGDMIHQIVADSNGVSYTLSFWARQGGGDVTNSAVHVLWNGNTLYNTTVGSSYTLYTFNVVGTGADNLAIGGWNSPSFNYIDDVTLTAVPEPASMAALGLGAVALLRRRKKA